MKILQIITLCELGGAQSVVINLANELCKEHEVIVAAGEGDGKMWTMLSPSIRQVKCQYLKRALSPINDLRTIFTFWQLYSKYKPDIIHLHSSKAGMLGRIAFPTKKVIYTVHGFDSIRLAYRKFLPIERYMQKACKAIVGVSNYDYKNMLYERITNNVYTIYNGINEVKLGNTDLLPNENKRKRILCIARVAKPKRLDIFIETAKLLPEYDFIWIGNQNSIENHPRNTYFLGNITNAAKYNKQVDLFMLSSDFEGLPMVIIEAMSCSLPIVASNVGGISEIVRNGENGFTVENDPNLFAEKIQMILNDSDLHNNFATNSYQIFKNELTVKKMVDAYMEIYKK